MLVALLAAGAMGVETDESAHELTTWVLAEVDRRLKDPVQQQSVRRMGFAHGATGLAYALARAAVQLEREDAAQVARQLGEAEEARIAARDGMPGSLQGLGPGQLGEPRQRVVTGERPLSADARSPSSAIAR